ncbi:MAG TPA: hypothetical protein VIK40_08770 [Geomonas sp.]
MKRHENALGIQEGACNLRAIARSLVDAADEAAGEGVGAEQDAAVRMIVHRLARLCRVDDIACGYDAVTLADTYCTLMHECKARAQEGRMDPVRIDNSVITLKAAGQAGLPESVQG